MNLNYREVNAHNDDLKIASHKLEEIKHRAQILMDSHQNKSYHKSYSIIAYILAILVFLIGVYKIYKYFRNTCCCKCLGRLCIKVENNIHSHPVEVPTVHYKRDEPSAIAFHKDY